MGLGHAPPDFTSWPRSGGPSDHMARVAAASTNRTRQRLQIPLVFRK